MRAGRRDQAPRSSAAIWVVAIWVVVSTAAHRPFAAGMTRKTDRGLRCKILVRPDAIRTRMKTLSSAATGKSSAAGRPASSAGQGKLSRNGRFQARRATLAKQHGQTTLASAAAWRACGLDQVAGVAPAPILMVRMDGGCRHADLHPGGSYSQDQPGFNSPSRLSIRRVQLALSVFLARPSACRTSRTCPRAPTI